MLVHFETKTVYIGQVTKQEDHENDKEFSYMRKSMKPERHFVFSVIPDVTLVSIDSIMMILPSPSLA